MANKDQKNSAEAYREERKARLAQSAKKNQKKSGRQDRLREKDPRDREILYICIYRLLPRVHLG